MLALQYQSYGGPEVLEWAQAPEPHAGPGRVRVAVRAAGLNPLDWKLMSGAMAQGKPPAGPVITGFDGAGVVDEVGDGVTGVAVGDEVLGLGQQTHAEFAQLTSWVPKPASLDWAVAGGLGVVGETGERGLRLLGVGQGSTMFIDGGAGGVGAVAVQLAVARGATVIASASPGNQDYLRELGATPVGYGDGVADRVRAAAGGQVDAVFDVAGRTPPAQLTGLVSTPTQVVSIANFGPDATAAGIRVTGGGADSVPVPALTEAVERLVSGQLSVQVQTFPFARAAEAFAISLGGHVRGKLVLVP